MFKNNSHKKVRILVSGFTSNYGGVETFLFQHFKHMNHELIHMDFLTHVKNPAFQKEIEDIGGKFFYIPVRNKYPLKYRMTLKEFFKEHAKEYDVFWCNKCMLNNIDFLKYAKRYQIPIRILHSHNSSNMDTGLKGKIMEQMHKRNKSKIKNYVTDFWACSDYAAKWLFPTDIYSEKKYSFVPNAVDVEKFLRNDLVRTEMREQLGVKDKFVIGHVGRFNYQKNHEFLIRIFKKVYERNQNACLLLVGTGELEDTVKQQVHDLNLENAVQFLGVRHDIAKLMQAMDCFVLPSRFEGLPVVAVEAQAAGLPCVLACDGITKEVKVNDNLTFLKLIEPEERWQEQILECANLKKEKHNNLENSEFEIHHASKRLEKVFQKRSKDIH